MTMINAAKVNEVIHSSMKRKRWTPLEKQQIVNETYHPGVSLSYVARKHGISPSQLFQWRKLMESGGIIAMKHEEKVIPLSEVKELERRIRQLGLSICTTPSYSPESNGIAEAFVKTFKRDLVWVSKTSDALTVMRQLPQWFESYNETAPHKGLKMLSPRQFIKLKSAG